MLNMRFKNMWKMQNIMTLSASFSSVMNKQKQYTHNII